MGRRKLRFHVRKNYERNQIPKQLIVSISLQSLNVLPFEDSTVVNDHSMNAALQAPLLPNLSPDDSSLALPESSSCYDSSSTCILDESHNDQSPVQLIISIPLSLYTSLSTHDSNQLRARLVDTQLITQPWTLSERSFILTMIHNMCSILYTITVATDCSWSLSVGYHHIDSANCHVLKSVPLKLHCVDHIVDFIKLLEQSKVCSGNAESKFMGLLEHHKGVFKNRSG